MLGAAARLHNYVGRQSPTPPFAPLGSSRGPAPNTAAGLQRRGVASPSMSTLEPSSRGTFSPMGHVFRHQQQPGAAEPGSSEFDAFIHSDLCVQDPAVASSMHPQPPPPQPPGAHVPATFPFVPYMCKQEDPALALWSTGTPPSALMCPDTTHAQAPAALRVPESSFANASIWTPSAAGQNATPTPQPLALSLIHI